MSRQARFSLTALALIALAGASLALADRAAVALPSPRLDSLPAVLASWTATARPSSALLPPDAGASRHLGRIYERSGRAVMVAVDYYADQSENRRPAARQLLFPGSGWTDLREEEVRVPLDGPGEPTLTANLILMRTAEQPVAILYWYQLPGRSIASDHWYRARLIWNRIIRGRADGALVRVAVPGARSAGDVAIEIGPFLRALYADLEDLLPR